MAPNKIDFKRELREFYAPGRDPELVDVPELQFAMIDGHGDPNTAQEYRDAVQALYAVAYTIRFALKRAPDGLDFGVMPLEGLWWAPDMAAFTTEDKSAWHWTAMIMQPNQVTPAAFDDARATAAVKKPLAVIDRVRLDRLSEGRAAQILHLGPYAAEGPTIARLHQFIADQGYALTGKHHEIYLGDPRRTAAEKLKTVIRQPVAPAKPYGSRVVVAVEPAPARSLRSLVPRAAHPLRDGLGVRRHVRLACRRRASDLAVSAAPW